MAIPRGAFGVTTPRDMFAKLGRELSRLETCKHNKDDVDDTAINFALSAWQLVDWVWKEYFQDKPDTWEQVNVNGRPGWKVPNSFRTHLTKQCPELGLCAGIAGNTKHVNTIVEGGVHRRIDGRSSARTTPMGQWTEDENGAVGGAAQGGAGAITAMTEYIPKIVDHDRSGTIHDARAVFRIVYQYWSAFMDEWGIG